MSNIKCKYYICFFIIMVKLSEKCKLGRVGLVVADASIRPILPAKHMYYCILTIAVVSTVALGWM
jgi:hypothetical protein